VVVRDTDADTRAYLRRLQNALPIKVVDVLVAGQVAAINTGLAMVEGDVTALTDDDAVPAADWLEKIVNHFESNDNIAGVGGRDFVYVGDKLLDGAQFCVGKLRWFGKRVGNHHLGVGPARPVDFLKGVNMAYRTKLLREVGFNTDMRGDGAQVNQEVSIGLELRRRGWQLIYDPQVKVNHYPSQRFDSDQRSNFSEVAQQNAVFNETIAVLPYLGYIGKCVHPLWAFGIGTRAAPGILQAIRLRLQRDPNALLKLRATTAGRRDAYAGIRRGSVR
jgi:cellulose synthase/poly-beta-1,6-N-acetylglucosamine synthase-like glycosyltransferase